MLLTTFAIRKVVVILNVVKGSLYLPKAATLYTITDQL